MVFQALKNLAHQKSLKQADIARLARVSRAAVTKWFQNGEATGWINVETNTLRHLAKSLGISPHIFLEERENISRYKTLFLWDRLYSNMESFLASAVSGELAAMARLTQVLGFRQAVAIIGPKAVSRFKKYKHFIKPQRRKQLETVWTLYNSKMPHP